MDLSTITATSLVIGILLIIVFVLLFRYLDNKVKQEYNDLTEEEYYKHVNPNGHCPSGCIKGKCEYNGVCNNPFASNPKCCVYNWQCKNCPDVLTQDEFVQEYEDIKAKYRQMQTDEDIKRLNDRIFKENVYIARINKYVTNDNNN